ncbi:estradiol 17-beta-dehydrogenase 2 [Trichonephila clavata]|uniref:Estradiol 17-beta-dehydrogenase 2 n=1 Tax=Trichonephila clavata TaxID=2740835 RepID=A0A8X6KFW1_TRICU|nr:estradiol 17-beta-dehydrogenase 2 [Trichonephila clavata]
MDRWLLAWFAYLASVALVLEVLCFMSPFIDEYYYFAAKILFCSVVGHWLFLLTQNNIFKKSLYPENKAVFITGCDSGFGYYLAKQLDRKGYHVFAGYLSPAAGNTIELKRECSERLRLVHIDVARDKSVQNAKELIENNLDDCELWAVVNNAGVFKGLSVEFSEMSDYQDTLQVNALGQVRVIRAFLPLLRKSKGRIVNVNSIAGRICNPHMTVYTMSKFASVAFTECLRREIEVWGIKVISVEPECFKTPMTNTENMRKYLESTCRRVKDGIRSDYGEQYMKRIQDMIAGTFLTSSNKLHAVTDAIEAAISLEHPCPVYKPSGNPIRHVIRCCAEILPSHLMDVFLRDISSITMLASGSLVTDYTIVGQYEGKEVFASMIVKERCLGGESASFWITCNCLKNSLIV